MSIAFIVSAETHDDVDEPLLIAAAQRAKREVHWCDWEDPNISWDEFDTVIFRSPWNYVAKLSQFTQWLSAFPAPQKLWNPIDVIAWNIDKSYLQQLDSENIPSVPTQFVQSADQIELAIQRCPVIDGANEVVLKPATSAGSFLTARFARDHFDLKPFAENVISQTGKLMIQPAIPSVANRGEISCVFFADEFSHSFRKGPILAPNGGLLGSRYQEKVSAELAPAPAMDLARELHRYLQTRFQLLYARYDMVITADGTPLLLEAELFEPCFFLPTHPAAADNFFRALNTLGI